MSEIIFSWTINSLQAHVIAIRWCAGSNPKFTFDLDPLLHLALRPGSEIRRQAKGLLHIPNTRVFIGVWFNQSMILLDLPLHLGELFCILWFLSFQIAEDYTEAVDIK